MEDVRKMKAIVRHRYGGPEELELADVDRPTPGPGEVLVQVRASSVSIGDWYWLTGHPTLMRAAWGIRRPKGHVPGRDMAGVVEAVGPGVTRLKAGDEVYGEVDWGAHAEYVVTSAAKITRKPANLTFEEAAAVPIAGVTSLQGLRDAGRLQPGGHVLVNGASGAVGSFAVQIGKALGAEVTGVCSTRNLERVRSLGADHVIDYTQADFTDGEPRYDLIFDLAGSRSIRACRRVLRPGGVYVSSVGRLGWIARAVVLTITSRGGVVMFAAKESTADLETLRGLIEDGTVRPVIDRTFSLDTAADAFRAQGQGHAQGRTVISV